MEEEEGLAPARHILPVPCLPLMDAVTTPCSVLLFVKVGGLSHHTPLFQLSENPKTLG